MDHRPTGDHEIHEHEHTDIPVRTIGKYMVGLLLGGVIIVIVLGGLWRLFTHAIPEEARVPAWEGPRELPPTPRLQIEPSADLAEYQRRELQRLNNYGWADRASGKVHIPIDRAMDAVVRTGLPARKTAPGSSDAERSNPDSGDVRQ